MIEYTEQAQMVDTLRYCADRPMCFSTSCTYRNTPHLGSCISALKYAAADMIEALFKQVEELRQEIAEKDKEIVDLTLELMSYPDEEAEREERCGL